MGYDAEGNEGFPRKLLRDLLSGMRLLPLPFDSSTECMWGTWATKGPFNEVEMTVDKSDILMGCCLNRAILRT
jgi:hypothetical protein